MKNLARFSLLLVVVLVVVSAYLRLHESGIGCPDWPACYGRIGQAPEPGTAGLAVNAYQRIVAESDAPLAWAAPLHRLVASLLGLAVLALNFMALQARQFRLACLALLALTVFLAWLGIRSGSLHHPGVVMGNLAGGFAMLGLLGWLVFRLEPGAPRPAGTGNRSTRVLVMAALAVLCLQIVLGGLTSANFAANACQTLPDCQGGYLPDASLLSALELSRSHEVDASGIAVGGAERVAIHRAHRIGSVLALAAVLAAALAALPGTRAARRAAGFIIFVLISEFAIGVAAIVTDLPMLLAVSHNLLAALLLLGLLKMLAPGRV